MSLVDKIASIKTIVGVISKLIDVIVKCVDVVVDSKILETK